MNDRNVWKGWLTQRTWSASGGAYAIKQEVKGRRQVFHAWYRTPSGWTRLSEHWLEVSAKQACERHANRLADRASVLKRKQAIAALQKTP